MQRTYGQPQVDVQPPQAPPASSSSSMSYLGLGAGLRAAYSLTSMAFSAAKASMRKMPTGPDGLSETFFAAPSDPHHQAALLQSVFQQIKQGTLVRDVVTMLSGVLQATSALDDRKLLLEKVVQMLSSMPADSPVGSTVTNVLLRLLWTDLDHPPIAFVGEARYRSADGAGNNPFMPDLGKAGTPYARSVPPVHPLPQNLPDPATIFDALLKREGFIAHPSGISSLLFSFATTIIHSAFQTSHEDPSINETSSYLDLSIIYGNNEKEQQMARTYKLGEMHPDVVSSKRLFMMPPAATVLCVMFTRNHNMIVRKLLEINENNRFSAKKAYRPAIENEADPAYQLYKSDPDGTKKQDEDLFQTARLINCGFYL